MKLRPLSLFLFAFVLALALAEVVSQIFTLAPRRAAISYNEHDYFWSSGQSDDYYSGHLPKKRFRIEFNNQGERSPDNISWSKAPNTFRVLLIGNSLGFGSHAEYEDSLAGHLRSHLLAHAGEKKVELINCSQIARNTLELYDIWDKRCSKYEGVDVVLLQTTFGHTLGSSMLFNGENAGRQLHIFSFLFQYYDYFRGREQAKDILRPRFFYDEFDLPALKTLPEERTLYASMLKPLSSMYDYLHAVRFIEHRWLWPYRLRFTRHTHEANYYGDFFEQFTEYCQSISERCPKSVPSSEATLKIVTLWNQRLKAAKTRFIIFSLPTVSVYEEPNETVDKMYADFQNSLKKSNIEFMDFVEPFRNESDRFLKDGFHLSPHANQIVGETLSQNILLKMNGK